MLSSIVLFTASIIPKALLIITNEVPPLLIIGSVCPVSIDRPMFTYMCKKACIVIRNDNPNTRIVEKSFLHDDAITILL